MTTLEVLQLALAHNKKIPSETLGNCLSHEMSDADFISIIKFLKSAIEDQYDENAPCDNTQEFLDRITYIEKNYLKFKG